MEGEKAAETVNEELHFQSSPVDFEVIFSLLKRRQSENESGVFFRKIYRRKENKVTEEEKGRGFIEWNEFICTLKLDETGRTDAKLEIVEGKNSETFHFALLCFKPTRSLHSSVYGWNLTNSLHWWRLWSSWKLWSSWWIKGSVWSFRPPAHMELFSMTGAPSWYLSCDLQVALTRQDTRQRRRRSQSTWTWTKLDLKMGFVNVYGGRKCTRHVC